jgi:hypothetical protein
MCRRPGRVSGRGIQRGGEGAFRAGGATDLFASGRMTHAEVMVMGRWKSLAAALVYFRADLDAARKSAQVFEEASAEYAAGKGARAARGA